MSTEVDSRVVQMQFDNARFEQNVRQSMNTLSQLDRKLELTGANRGLEEVAARANSIDLNNISSAVDSLSNRFSTMGIIGMTAIQNITNSVLNLGKKAASTVFNLVKSGGINRALNIEQAKFQLEGLNVGWEKLEKQINYGVKDTAYGLDSAAKVAAQLVASGVEFSEKFDSKKPDKMAMSLRAVSGVAAMTNSTYDDMGRIFTTVAGNGRLMGEQLLQLSTRGLNAAAAIGKYLGKSEEEVRDMVSKGKIDFETFASAMDSAFGKHAKDANKTFTGALSNVKAALSRFGAKFATPGLENLRDIFNETIPIIDNFSAAFDPMVNLTTRIMKDATKGITGFLKKIDFDPIKTKIESFESKLLGVYDSIKKVIKWIDGHIINRNINAKSGKGLLNSLIGDDKTPGRVDAFQKSLKILEKNINSISKTARGDFKTFLGLFNIKSSNITDFAKGTVVALSKVVDVLKVLSDKAHVVFKSIVKYKGIFNNLKDTIKGVASVFGILLDIFSTLIKTTDSDSKGLKGFLDVILGIVSKITGFTAKVGQFITDLHEYLQTSSTLSDIFEKFNATLSVVGQPILGFLKRIRDALSSLFSSKDTKDNEERFEKIQNTSLKFTDFLDRLKNKLETFSEYLRIVKDKLKNAFEPIVKNFKEAFKNLDIERIIRTFNLGMIGAILRRLFKLLDNRRWKEVNSFRGLGDNIATFIKQIENCFTEFQKTMKEQRLRKIATSIAILAGALFVMSLIDGKKLAGTMTAMTVMFGELFSMMAGLSVIGNASKNVGFDIRNLESMTRSLIRISAAMLIMSSAFKKLGTMDWKQYAVATAGLTTILTELTIAMAAIGSIKGDKSVKSMVTLSIVLTIMAHAFKSFGSMKWSQYAVATAGLSTVLLELISAALLLSNFSGSKKAVGTMTSLAISLVIIAKAFQSFGDMNWEQYKVATAGISTVLAELVAVSITLSRFKGNKSVSGMILMATSLVIIAKAFQSFGDMNWEQYKVATAGISTVLAELVAAMVIVSNFSKTGGGASLLISASSLVVLASAFEKFGNLSWKQFAVGVAAMSASLALLLGAAAVASIGPVAAGLVILSGAIALIGAGALMAGVGMTAFAAGLTAVVTVGTAGIALLVLGITEIITLIPQFMSALGVGFVKLIVSFLETLAENQNKVLTAFAQLLIGMLDMIYKYLPQFVEKGAKIIAEFLRGIADNMQDITEAGLDIIINFLKGIAEKADDVVAAAIDVIISILEGFAGKMEDITQAGWDVIISFIDGLAASIDENMPRLEASIQKLTDAIIDNILDPFDILPDNMCSSGINALEGFLKGLKDKHTRGRIDNEADKIGRDSSGRLNKSLQVKSPSRVTYKSGRFFGMGYANGIKSFYSKVMDISKDLGEGSASALQTAISRVSDILDSDMTLSPTITPVIDLSSVRESASEINGLLGGQSHGISANIGAINALMAQRQSGANTSDIVDAVNRLKRSIEDNPSVINNVNGVTYDDGSNISNAVNDLIHAIKVERRV